MTTFAHAWRPTRRGMLATSLGVATAGATAVLPPGGVFAAGTDRIRVGLIGCGGRGTGAARQAAAAHPDVRIVAMGDLFADHLAESATMLAHDLGDRFVASPENRFAGQKAWQQVLDSDIDAVILAATPWSRPIHLAGAIARDIHVYAERPAASDLAGLQMVFAACADAEARGLVVVSGFASRHHRPVVETLHRVRGGAIGRPLHAECRALIGLPWQRAKRPEWSREEVRQRNWVVDRNLSGGPLLERHLDAVDRGLQIFGDACPIEAVPSPTPSGAAVCYRYVNGATLRAQIGRSAGLRTTITERVTGTVGTADLAAPRIDGPASWHPVNQPENPWQNCMSFFIRELLANGRGDGGIPLCRSTGAAILGQLAIDESRVVTWDELEGQAASMTGII